MNDNKENKKLKLKVFTAFSGYDSQCMALERLKENYDWFDYELVGWSEIDEPAISSHNAVFPEAADKNLGDISKVNWENVPDFDLFTYSSPCLTGDQIILTKDGYKPIIEIEAGDEVLTKSNTWHKVVQKFDNGLHRTCYVSAMGFDKIHCTLNHKFYVRKKGYKSVKNEEKNCWEKKRIWNEPEFVEAKDLTKDYFLGVPIITDEIPFHTDEDWFWYLMGMYVGDGHCSHSVGHEKEVIISVNKDKLEKLYKRIPKDKLDYNVVSANENDTCFRFYFRNKELREFIETTFGNYSDGKIIPGNVIMLPKKELEAFYDGYRDSDGCTLKTNSNVVQFTSVNKNLIYSISLIINKLFRRPTKIYYVKTPDTYVIEGRTVNQKDWYQLRYLKEHTKQEHAFIEDDYIWYPFQSLETSDEVENVYNIEVEDEHSYILSGCVSKNCQDFSVSGKQRGGEKGAGTRSSLLWECERTIREKRPKYCLLENVKALYSDKKFYPLLMRWKRTVDSYGYNSFIQVLNAADYDVPQGRERVFMISIRKDENDPDPEYYFPVPMKRTREIEDFLLPMNTIPEEYYLEDSKIPKFLDLLYNTGDEFDEKTTMHKDLVKTDSDSDEETVDIDSETSEQALEEPENKELEVALTLGFVPEKNEYALF